MKISVIIPIHKINNIIFECINKIYKQISYHELIIASDNIDFSFKGAKIIKSDKQLYANGIRNLAAKHATGDYFLFIDSDIIVQDDFIKNLEKILNKKKIDILNFPINKEQSSNIFAKYKGFREKFFTFVLIKENLKNIKVPFYGFASIFSKKVFMDLGGWPEKQKYDFIMEHEGFQQIIFNSKYKNEIAENILVNHYHHKNLDLFKNIILRTRIWTIKKFRNEVSIDFFKSKKSAVNSILIFFSLLFIMINIGISILLILFYILNDLKFLRFLFVNTKIFFVVYFFINYFFLTCVFVCAMIGVVQFNFLKK